MKISVKEKSRKIQAISSVVESAQRIVPDYLSLESDKFSGTLLAAPSLEQVEALLPLPINIPLVCDFLSHQH
jgi:small subunit ribosomal protein S4